MREPQEKLLEDKQGPCLGRGFTEPVRACAGLGAAAVAGPGGW